MRPPTLFVVHHEVSVSKISRTIERQILHDIHADLVYSHAEMTLSLLPVGICGSSKNLAHNAAFNGFWSNFSGAAFCLPHQLVGFLLKDHDRLRHFRVMEAQIKREQNSEGGHPPTPVQTSPNFLQSLDQVRRETFINSLGNVMCQIQLHVVGGFTPTQFFPLETEI